jgi:hypothetical protein
MKKTSVTLTLAFLSVLFAMPLPALAQHRDRGWRGDIRHFERHDVHQWHSGVWQHGHHDGRLGWWWVVGGMWYFYPQPVYPYPDPYTPPVVVIQQTAPAVVAQPAPPATTAPAAAAPQYWYYCESSKTYYPYVSTCAEGWKAVPAQPAGVTK